MLHLETVEKEQYIFPATTEPLYLWIGGNFFSYKWSSI